MSLFERIRETTSFIRLEVSSEPKIGIILGSGLGGLVNKVDSSLKIPYGKLPHFPVATVKGHEGQLVFGSLAGKDVVMMDGRFHYYEGYNMAEITFPVRVMKQIGVETLIISNAAGGMNSQYQIGDIVILNDMINLFPDHPLRGPNDERFGERFLDMSEPFDRELIRIANQIAHDQGLTVHSGTYAGLQGPTFETPAEYNWLRTIGADLVGMSTVPEVIVARHSQLRVFATSIITDLALSKEVEPITYDEVLAAAEAAAPKLAQLVVEMIRKI